jgi:hypothetical protein
MHDLHRTGGNLDHTSHPDRMTDGAGHHGQSPLVDAVLPSLTHRAAYLRKHVEHVPEAAAGHSRTNTDAYGQPNRHKMSATISILGVITVLCQSVSRYMHMMPHARINHIPPTIGRLDMQTEKPGECSTH